MFGPRNIAIAVVALSLSACGVQQESAPSIGEAYAGPADLVLHTDIDLKSKPAAVVHHGERLQIMAQRRRWYRVRSQSGAEGWTDDRQLLDKAQMSRLRQLSKETAGLPSQGTATCFDTLNIHTEPNRFSPSFTQAKEGEKFELIAHRVVDRAPLPKRQLIEPKPKRQRKGKQRKKPSYPEPDPPAPPRPPSDWLEISRQRGVPLADIADEQVPQDDWTLVRTRTGQSGWVLTRLLYLSIPDEVAQYAEGHRIMSYFSLGKMQDGDVQKDIWLWTTADHLGEDHDFDGYRVFVWSTKRHRYETAYIQRRIRGFFPVLAKQGEFSVCLENEGGTRVRKMYALNGNIVRPAGEKPCEAAVEIEGGAEQQLVSGGVKSVSPENKSSGNWIDRLKNQVTGWFQRKPGNPR